MLKGFQSFDKSKVISDTVHCGTNDGLLTTKKPKLTAPKGGPNPTEGTMEYSMSNRGGSSGDGPTPGFIGSGRGIAELNNAQQ